MKTLDLHGLLIAGALLIPHTASAVAGEDLIPTPKGTPDRHLTLPTIQSTPWWLDAVRLDQGVKVDSPRGQKVDLLDPKLLQMAPTRFAGRSAAQAENQIR